MPDVALLFEQMRTFGERLAALAADTRETRRDLARVEEALALALGKLRELESAVFDHRRRALEALALLERELADVTALAANDLGSLALRVATLEEYVARRQGGGSAKEAPPCPSKPGWSPG